MNREGKQQIDRLMRYAKDAGFEVEADRGNYWRLIHPTNGTRLRVPGDPAGRRIDKERSRLRRFGAPLTAEDVAAQTAARELAAPPPPPPPEPPAQEPPTMTATTRTAPTTATDIPSYAYVLWGTIREKATQKQDLDGVPGLLWRESLVDLIVTLWPQLKNDEPTRKKINYYLRNTGNMLCLQRGTRDAPSMWWLRDEWRDTDRPEGGGFVPVRTVRHPEPRTSAGPPAPVTVRKVADAPHAPTPQRLNGADPVAAISAVIEENTGLRAARDELTGENRALRAERDVLLTEIGTLRAQLAAIKAALGKAGA